MDVRVNKGDSIWKIAKARKPEGVSTAEFVQQILDLNDLEDPDKLKIGQVLQVPGEEPPTPRPRPIEIGEGSATTGSGGEMTATYPTGGELTIRPASEQEVIERIRNGETRQNRDQLANLAAELKARYGNVSGVSIGGPPLPEKQAERYHPVPAQKQERGIVDEVLGRTPAKDQSRLPEEVMLDLDVLGLTPRRVPRETPVVSPGYTSLPPPRSQYVSQAAQLPSAPDRGEYTVGDPGGLLEEGNIPLGTRKRVENPDGTFSTVLSKSFEEDGVEVLVPTLDPDGNPLTDQQAVDRYYETGEHLGKFDTPEAATAYAIRLSERQNPMIPRDPDNYIDLGSERWRDVFVRAPAEAARLNRERSRNQQRARDDAAAARRKAAQPVRPPRQSTGDLDWIKRVISGTQGPTMQPTKVPNGSK